MIKGGFNASQDPQLMITVTVSPPNLTPLDAVFVFELHLITLVIKPKDGSLTDILGWLAFLTPGASQDDVKSVETWVKNISPNGLSTIREMRLAVNKGKLRMFFLELELDVDFGQSPDATRKVAFFVSLCSFLYSISRGASKIPLPHLSSIVGFLDRSLAAEHTLGGALFS